MTANRASAVGTPTPAVMEALNEALQRLGHLEDAVDDLTYACRWPDGHDLDVALLGLVEQLRALAAYASVAAQAVSRDLGVGPVDLGANEETRDAILQLVTDRELDDWTSIADTIDEVITPVLAEWRGVLTALAASCAAAAAPGRAAEGLRAA